jgi:hypothetical protein
VAARPGGTHCSHSGRPGGKPQPLRVAPEDCGTLLALRRSASFEPRHRSLPLGIRLGDLAGRHRDIRLAAVVAAEAVAAHTAVDERIQLERATAVTSGKSAISSLCNLASSHLLYSQVRHEDRNTGRPPVLRGGEPTADTGHSMSHWPTAQCSLKICKFLCWATNGLPRRYREPCRRPTSQSRRGAGSALPERARRHRCAQLPF